MKILSVVVGTLGDNAASVRIWNIARLLQLGGHEVHLLRFMRPSDYEGLENTFDLSDIPNSAFTVSTPTIHMRILREIAKGGYDLVYGNTHYGAFCSILGKLKGVPLVFDMHGGLIEEFLLNKEPNPGWKYSLRAFQFIMKRVIDLAAIRFSSRIVCVSHKMIHYLHEVRGVPLAKMFYVTNGVDLEFFKPQAGDKVCRLNRKLNLEKKLVFGYMGGFARWQGVENLIEATKGIDSPELAFVIVGAENKSRQGNTFFIPRVSRRQLLDYYSICDVLVLPRPSHPATEMAAPTKFAEYTAMGKPILTSNVGDAAEFVRKYRCGIVIPSNSPEDLAKGIMQFREMPERELRTMGENSRHLAESEFDWNKVADNLLGGIRGIVRKHRRARS